MSFIPVVQSHPSGRAYELGARLKQTIDGFRQEHPSMSATEIRQAVDFAMKGRGAGVPPVALVIGTVLFVIFGLLAFLFLEVR